MQHFTMHLRYKGMKRIFSIMFLMIATSVFSQSKSQLIWDFANNHIGQKVGDGICRTLIMDAYKQIGIDLRFAKSEEWASLLGRLVERDSASEGDVVLIVYRSKSGKEISSHIGIVYGVSETNMSIANQNTYSRLKDSEVEITLLSEAMAVNEGESSECYFFHLN